MRVQPGGDAGQGGRVGQAGVAHESRQVGGIERDLEVISAPPPSSGGIALLEILNILEGFDLGKALAEGSRRPVRVLNDAGVQGYGVIEGKGLEMVLTLGTGLGCGLYLDGKYVPNLELAHHPFRHGKSGQPTFPADSAALF